MPRDPFFVQIKDGLSQPLDPDLFERCAADLLRAYHPSLVPVCGGNDSGFDGAVADNEGEPFPLIATTAKDAIGNLTRNWRRYEERGGLRKRAVFATSRALTPRRRENLFRRAQELGFMLVQVYDQEALSNLLYHAPHTCKELLGLSGSPSALSHIPKTARLPMPGQQHIGRDNEFEWLLNAEGDRLIVGQPGSGKTCILYQLAAQDSGLFAVSENMTAIANAIRKDQPPAVFVDDAGGQLELLADLVHWRRTADADFSIVAACWPGDKDEVSRELDLCQADTCLLPRLTRDQIVEVVKQAGMEQPNDLVRYIVDQAVGLPGLATTLARLYLDGAVDKVVSGDILKQDLLRFIKAEPNANAKDILAGFSVGGEAGIVMSAVAEALDLRLLEVRNILTRLATAGVIADNPHRRSYHSSSDERTIAVQPASLRYALVWDAFFSGPAPLPKRVLDELIQRAPAPGDVAETMMEASVYVGEVPEALLQELVERAGDADTYNWYVAIGRSQARWVLEQRPDLLLIVGEYALESAPTDVIPPLLTAAVTAPRLLNEGDSEPIRLINTWTLSGKPGTGEALYRRRIVLEAAIGWLRKGGDIDVAVSASCIAVSPAYETATTDPGAGSTLTVTSGLLTPYEIRQLKSLWDELLKTIAGRDDFHWDPIFRALHGWAYPSSLMPSWNAGIHAETRQAAAEVAVAVVEALATMVHGRSAALQRLKDYIEVTGARVELQLDEVMALFCPDPDKSDWRASARRRDRNLFELASKWHTRQPEKVVADVTSIEKQAAQAGIQVHHWMIIFHEKLSQLVENPVAWSRALIYKNASADYVAPFLGLAVASKVTGWPEVAFACLEKPALQRLAVRIALEEPELEPELFSRALALVARFPNDVEVLCRRGKVPVDILRLLLEHANRDVAIGAAKGEWNSNPCDRVRESVKMAWRRAVVQHGTNEYFLEQAFKDDPDLAESWLLARMQDDSGSYYSLDPRNADGTLSVAMRVQNASSRALLLSRLAEHTTRQERYRLRYREWTTLIVGDSPALQRQLLEDARLKDYHLAPLRRHALEENHLVLDSCWMRFALLAFETGHTAKQIFRATCPDQYFPRSDLYAVWADDFGNLLSHEEHVIRQVGEMGHQWAIEAQEKSIEEERSEAVYGSRW